MYINYLSAVTKLPFSLMKAGGLTLLITVFGLLISRAKKFWKAQKHSSYRYPLFPAICYVTCCLGYSCIDVQSVD
jgi:hypothetical protein